MKTRTIITSILLATFLLLNNPAIFAGDGELNYKPNHEIKISPLSDAIYFVSSEFLLRYTMDGRYEYFDNKQTKHSGKGFVYGYKSSSEKDFFEIMKDNNLISEKYDLLKFSQTSVAEKWDLLAYHPN